jgi:hypothetical protein
MKKIFNKKSWFFLVAVLFIVAGVITPKVMAEGGEIEQMNGISMSPMDQEIVLNPGDTYESSVRVTNPGTNTMDVDYQTLVEPFYRNDEDAGVKFESKNGRGDMAEWITITSNESGHLAPGETAEITFRIDVPETAPAGGQYASVIASSTASTNEKTMIEEKIQIAHLIYAEIAGATTRNGELVSIDVPAFLLSGNVRGMSTIKNTGNVHGTASYKMQVFPLFSDEEIYTNEEDPETHLIMPDQTYYTETAWENTPEIGIFNVVYTVEFEGETLAQASKMVIKCPIWLLAIILFIIIAIAIWLATRSWGRKKNKRAKA